MERAAAPQPFLATELLLFRTWAADDVDRALVLWGDPAVTRFIAADGCLSPAAVRERLEREIACQEAHGFQYWPVFLRAGGDLVGCCGLRPYRPELRIPELGVHLRRVHWGRGLAAEAARAVISHAFRDLGAEAIFAGHHPENGASERLLARLGFCRTGEELYEPTGRMHPSYLLSRDAWIQRGEARPAGVGHNEEAPDRAAPRRPGPAPEAGAARSARC